MKILKILTIGISLFFLISCASQRVELRPIEVEGVSKSDIEQLQKKSTNPLAQ